MCPKNSLLAAGGTLTFISSGGVPPYTYSVISGGGTFKDAIYTAPPMSNGLSILIKVTDSVNSTAQATITVPSTLTSSAMTIAITNPVTSAYVNTISQSNFTISGSCNRLGSVSISVGTISIGSTSCDARSWVTNTADFTNVPDGDVSIAAILTEGTTGVSVTSNPVTIFKDATPPTSPTNIDDGLWATLNTSSPYIRFTAGTDSGSGIRKHLARVVRASDSVAMGEFSIISDNTPIVGLNLSNDILYIIQIKAIDDAGNESTLALSDGWTIDSKAPSEPGAFVDGKRSSSLETTPVAKWEPSTDLGSSGLLGYQMAVGSTPGGIDLYPWTSIGNVSSKKISGLTLVKGNVYYTSLRAFDKAGNMSTIVQGDGWIASDDICDDEDVTPGTVCKGGNIYVGSIGTTRYMTTPSGCTRVVGTALRNEFTASCPGTTDYTYYWGAATDTPYSPSGLAQVNNTNPDPNSGNVNTQLIIAYTNSTGRYIAPAMYCDKMNYGGYKDWFLPNREELGLMNTNRSAIPNFKGQYWSSSVTGRLVWWQATAAAPNNQGTKEQYWSYLTRCMRSF